MDSAQNYTAKLREKLSKAEIPTDLLEKLTLTLDRIEKIIQSSGYKIEFDKELAYLEFMSSLPFKSSSPDILDLGRVKAILDHNHYGLEKVKERILEYLSVLILNNRAGERLRSPVLAFVGLAGSGKTSLAYSIAQSLGRQLIRIPLGGLGSVKELRGQSRANFEAEPGRIIKEISRIGFNNPVILLDEIDRVAMEARNDVMGVLVELLDPEQNFSFVDRFTDYPFDLSKALFVVTANNTSNIATAVLDRLELIEMPSYSDEEKITIGRSYLLPRALKEAGLSIEILVIDENLWPQIVRPLGYDSGIRSLQRNIQGIVRKVAKGIVQGKGGQYHITETNIGEYLN